jgi:hypothetical protein
VFVIRGFGPLRRLAFAWTRCVASARAGSWGFRRKVRFGARAIDQDGVLLLMPSEPSLAFVFVPALLIAAFSGAALALFG